MFPTIGLTCNFYNEARALLGWLETHVCFFDAVVAYHAGPRGEYSNDGSIELLEKWGIPITYGSIDDGFGAVRTKAVRACPTDWVMLLDCDERFYPFHRVLICDGEGTPQTEVDAALRGYDFRNGNVPNWDALAGLGAGLRVTAGDVYDQGAILRRIIGSDVDAVCTIRRHWHDFTWRRPTQDWRTYPDWQMRCVRNMDSIYFSTETRMHEKLCGFERSYRPDFHFGPFFDHFHFSFKKLEPEQRAHDIAVYDAIHRGDVPPTRDEFYASRR